MFAEPELIEERIHSKFSRDHPMPNFNSPTNQMKFEDIYPEEEMAGGIFTGSTTSRARLFSQQRELMSKKRAQLRQNDGMIRRSTASDEQFTPAIRQFSAPKSLSTDSSEFAKSNPLFNKSNGRKSASNSDEETKEVDEDSENHPNVLRQPQKRPSYKTAKPLSQERYMDESVFSRTVVNTSQANEADLGFSDDQAVIDLYADEMKPSRTPKSAQKKKSKSARRRQQQQEELNNSQQFSADEQQPYPRRDKNLRNRTPRKKRSSSASSTERNANATEAALNRSQEQITISRPILLDLSNMREFLTTPIPKSAGIVQCYIRRNTSGTNRLYPKYSLFMKDGDVFLLSSKKRPNNKTSNYLISMDQQDLSRQSSSYLGKVRSNFLGTEYQIFNDGVNPKDRDADDNGNIGSNIRCELGAVTYAATFTTSAPRKMQVVIPALDNTTGLGKIWKDNCGPNGEGDDLLSRIKTRNWSRDCHYYINKPPRWNEQIGGYVLNFHGRVTMASVKNFQIVDPEEQNTVTLQFGKVSKDEFTMDLQYPMTIFQAFAIALTSFDSKIACD